MKTEKKVKLLQTTDPEYEPLQQQQKKKKKMQSMPFAKLAQSITDAEQQCLKHLCS